MFGMDGGRRLMDRDTSKAQNIGVTLRRLSAYFGRYTVVVVIVAALILFSAWTQVTAPDLIGQAVDCYINPTQFTQSNCWYASGILSLDNTARIAGLAGLVLRVVALYVSGALVGGLMFYLMNWAGQHVLNRLRKEIFDQVHRLSLSYYSKHEVGDVMARITSDSDAIQQALSFALVNVMSGIVLIAWIIYSMLAKSLVYGLITLTVLPFMAVATVYLSGQARKAFRVSRQEMGSVNADLQENIAAVREVQAFNRESENIVNFRRTNAANRDANIRAVAFTSALSPVLEFLSYIAIAIVVGIGGIWALRGTPVLGTVFSLGLVATFLLYVQRFNQPVQQIAVLWTNIQNAIAGAERIFGLLDEPAEIRNRPDAKPLAAIQGRVDFNDVWAEYEPGQAVLKGVNLRAAPGQTIAIVGPTGAGKTTIINLLPRFYDVTRGSVQIDGTDVRDVTLESLRSQIGIVLQDNFLFSDTIKNNIRYGRPDATDEEVIAAAKLARADQFVERLPEGYDTELGERGGGLSQGQRQLLAIARAALADPRILILDEATSSVDTRTEKLIQEALEKLLAGRTSFVVAHRLSTVRKADQILVLRDGQIIERGKFDELLAQQGFFAGLYNSQFRREAPGVGRNFEPALTTGDGAANGRAHQAVSVS